MHTYIVHYVLLVKNSFTLAIQGSGTPIHAVLQAATTVKIKVNSELEMFSIVNPLYVMY